METGRALARLQVIVQKHVSVVLMVYSYSRSWKEFFLPFRPVLRIKVSFSHRGCIYLDLCF